MYKNILMIGTLFTRSGEGLSRDIRTVSERGHRPRPVISGIDSAGEPKIQKKDAHFIPEEMIQSQIDKSFEVWPIHAVKTGYIGRASHITAAARVLEKKRKIYSFPIIVDPAILNYDGSQNYGSPGMQALKRDLIIQADIITPSVEEAEILSGIHIRDPDQLREAAAILLTLGPKAVLVRGGHFGEDYAMDVLVTENAEMTFKQPRLMKENIGGVKGYGSVIASVIASGLAEGQPYSKTIDDALTHVQSTFLSDL